MLREMSVTVAILFITSGVLVNAQSAAEDAAGIVEVDAPRVYYDIHRNLSLNCSIPNNDKTQSYVWKKNKLPLDEVPGLKDRYTLEEGGAVFKVKGKAAEEDFGSYSCELGDELRAWEVHGRPIARLPDNTNVVEGQNIKLQCKVLGKPAPRVWWTYEAAVPEPFAAANSTGELPAGARVSLERNEQQVENATLVLSAAQRADAGVYVCHAGDLGAADHTTLRVKDMYAALWPFLGICAEVFVLCAIILVYEKRRTKPELDDSDTDNHDQKKS